MGFFDIFKKKSKYNSNPKDNVPELVYGIPNVKKYNVVPDDNVPREVYGIPNPKAYNIDPEKNIPEKVYGIKVVDRSSDNFNIDINKNSKILSSELVKMIFECAGKDVFWSDLIEKYFLEDVKYDDNTSIELLKRVAKDKEVFNEFTKYLVKKSYDIDNPIKVDGITAKELAIKNPKKSAIEIYAMMSKFKNKH